jgi:hypothetical protein
MGQEGDRGKSPNKTGTQPNTKTKSPKPPDKMAEKGGESQRSANTRAESPKKVTARTTKKSRDK